MVTEFSLKSMLPLNLWSKQHQAALQQQTSPGSDSGSVNASAANASLLAAAAAAQMPFAGHPGFLPVSFSSALFRPGEHGHPAAGLYSYPALHPSFFRPHLDPATLGSLLNSRGMAGLHHSVSSGEGPGREIHPSAFTPAKRLRIGEDPSGHSPRDAHTPHSPRDDPGDTSSSSTRTSPVSPAVHSHSLGYSPGAAPGHDYRRHNGDLLHAQHHLPHLVNGAEDLRLKWKCKDGEGICCPVCKALLQPGEIRTHLYKEFTSLKEELRTMSHSTTSNTGSPRNDLSPGGCYDMSELHNSSSSRSRYDTFLRIRRNREVRLGKIRGDRKRKRFSDEMSHTSMTNEHDDVTITSEHIAPDSPKFNKDTAEDETVDVTSCEDTDVVYTSPVSEQSALSECKSTMERDCVPRQPPGFPDQQQRMT